MKRLMIKYKVKEKKLTTFKKEVEKFVVDIQTKEPDILEYNIFQGPDGVSFVHYVSFKDEDAEKLHSTQPHTKRFASALKSDAETEPEYIWLNNEGQASGISPRQEEMSVQAAPEEDIHLNQTDIDTLAQDIDSMLDSVDTTSPLPAIPTAPPPSGSALPGSIPSPMAEAHIPQNHRIEH